MQRVLIGSLCLIGWAVAPAGAETWEKVLRQMNDLYYTPAHVGVRDLSAKVKTSLGDVLAKDDKTLKRLPMEIRFYWRAPADGRFTVEIAGLPQTATGEAFKLGVESLLTGRDLLVAPPPLANDLANYACMMQEKDGLQLFHGVARSASAPVRTFDLAVDSLSLRIQQIYQELPEGRVLTQPEYITRDGRFLLERQRRVYRDIRTKTELEWQRAPGKSDVWVVSKLTAESRSVARRDMPPATIVLEFSDWRINEGVPDAVFAD